MLTEKPQQPRPEDFGLTKERCTTFESLFFISFDLFSSIEFWIPYGVIVLTLGILTYHFTASYLITFLLLSVGTSVIWRRLQPDYQNFRRYRSAKENYHKELETWIRTQESWWQSLDGRSFEIELGALLQKRGYRVQWTGKSGDQGVDLILFGSGGHRIIVQCKAHRKPIGPAAIRDLYGTLKHLGEKEAWLVSSSGFSKAANEFAMGKPIQLLSIRDILHREPTGNE
ncbi:MAG: restriction endonuclease [Acidobacteria bacterium]|nr:restriction endonuclease [Acidobacteriota bacterium]